LSIEHWDEKKKDLDWADLTVEHWGITLVVEKGLHLAVKMVQSKVEHLTVLRVEC
jgi:hypothetical protein